VRVKINRLGDGSAEPGSRARDVVCSKGVNRSVTRGKRARVLLRGLPEGGAEVVKVEGTAEVPDYSQR